MRDVTTTTAGRISDTVEAREPRRELRVAATRQALLAATTRAQLTAVVQVDEALRGGG
jgi:hypothetical protein